MIDTTQAARQRALSGRPDPDPWPKLPGQERAGLSPPEMLPPEAFPGAAPSPSPIRPASRLVGDFAECSVNGQVLAVLFAWRIKMRTNFWDSSGHGDTYKRWQLVDVEWSAEAEGYVVPGGAAAYLALAYNQEGPVPLTFAGYDGPAAGTANRGAVQIFAGSCFVLDGEISVPIGLATQRLTFQGDGVPRLSSARVAHARGGAPVPPAALPRSVPGAPSDPASPGSFVSGSSPVAGGGVRVGTRR